MPPRPPVDRLRAALQAVALLVVGAVLLVALVRVAGPSDLEEALEGADLRLVAWAVVLFCSQIVTVGLRWFAGMRLLGLEVSFTSLMRAHCGASVVNFLAPGHFGEPLLAAWLGRSGRAPGVEAFTVLVAVKLVATLLNLALLLLALPWLAGGFGGGMLLQVGAVAAVLLLGTLAFLGIALHPAVADRAAAVTGWLLGFLGRLAERGGSRRGLEDAFEQAGERLVGRFRQTLAVFATSPRALLAVAALSAVKMATMIAVFTLLYRALGVDVGVLQATFLESVDAFGNLLAVWIPGNLGVQEAVHAGAASGGLALPANLTLAAALFAKLGLAAYILASAAVFVGLGWFERR